MPCLYIGHTHNQTVYKFVKRCTTNIFQGVKTSADNIFVLKIIERDKYLKKNQKEGNDELVEIEDELMRPIASCPEVNWYIVPCGEFYLLFSYIASDTEVRILSSEEISSNFPKGWAYLNKCEHDLRSREKYRFDNDHWYCKTENLALMKQA